ncbi:PAS domain-containing protein [Streptomyces sp. S07_1.15]|uniref:PAS domain-containing protein n=1 Tax=Streptomyces sp. S07_1.15 TaxID=2873925 RepID=UPI001D150830|nr:PAS domain-containing protein [Streptomyces sp. S07_1.15]MCC3652740.1 PAS domain-containing protein [Streptomyces sp. S07_1.15]
MSSRPSRGAARLAAILDALPDALLLVNCNGTVVNANTIALETFESPGTALVGRGLLDLLPSFDSKRIPGSMRRPDKGDEGRTKPTRMLARRTDGSEFPVEVTSANLEDGRTPYESAFEAAYADHHHYTGDELLMLVVRDLTGTLDTEAELARQQRQTEMILRAAAEGVIGVDGEGRVVLVNPAAAQILGYRASDLGGKELHPLIHHSRADGSPLPFEETPLAGTLKSGLKHRMRGQVLWAKDGRPVPVDLTTAPVRDGDQLVGAVLAFTDRRQYDALAARHAQLLAVLDQSLRGPLDQLSGELGGLAADPGGQLWPEANQILHHLAAGYSRMTTLVDNVLAYQRLDTGKEKLRREPVSMDAVVAAGVEGAVELIGPGRAQFAVHAPAIEAEVDGERLATALAHLIADVAGVDSTGNTMAGGGSGDSTIVVAAAQRGEVVRIEVRGPYTAGDPVHGPIVRGIVRRHGGVLQTHEVPGVDGSAYVLEVPLTADAGSAVRPQGDADRDREGETAATVMPVPTAPARGTPDAPGAPGMPNARASAPASEAGGAPVTDGTATAPAGGAPGGGPAENGPGDGAGTAPGVPGPARPRRGPRREIGAGPQTPERATAPAQAAAHPPAQAPPAPPAGRRAMPALPPAAGDAAGQQGGPAAAELRPVGNGLPSPGGPAGAAGPTPPGHPAAPPPSGDAADPAAAAAAARPTGRRRGRPSPAEEQPGAGGVPVAPQAEPAAPQGRRARHGGPPAAAPGGAGPTGPQQGRPALPAAAPAPAAAQPYPRPGGEHPGAPPHQAAVATAPAEWPVPREDMTGEDDYASAAPQAPSAENAPQQNPAGRRARRVPGPAAEPGTGEPMAGAGAGTGWGPQAAQAPAALPRPAQPQDTPVTAGRPQPGGGTGAPAAQSSALPQQSAGAPAGRRARRALAPGDRPIPEQPQPQTQPPSQPQQPVSGRAQPAPQGQPGQAEPPAARQAFALPPAEADRQPPPPPSGAPAVAVPVPPGPAGPPPAPAPGGGAGGPQPYAPESAGGQPYAQGAPAAGPGQQPRPPQPSRPRPAQPYEQEAHGQLPPGADQDHTPPQPHPLPTGRRRARPAPDAGQPVPGGTPPAPQQAAASTGQQPQPGWGTDGRSGHPAAPPAPAPAAPAPAQAPAHPGGWGTDGRGTAAAAAPAGGQQQTGTHPYPSQPAPDGATPPPGGPAATGRRAQPPQPAADGPAQPAPPQPAQPTQPAQPAPARQAAPEPAPRQQTPAPHQAPPPPQAPRQQAVPLRQLQQPAQPQQTRPPVTTAQEADTTQGRSISVRTLGQGVPFVQQIAERSRAQQQQTSPQQPSAQAVPQPGGRRRKLAAPPETEPTAGTSAAAPPPGRPRQQTAPQPNPQQPPRLLDSQGDGRAYAIGAPQEGSEGPEPLDGPNGAVDVTDAQTGPPLDDELPPEPLDNPRRLLVWPVPDVGTQQALSDRGYRPVIVNSREEVDAQIAAYPAALFVDPLTGPITRTALQSLRAAAVAAEVPVLVTAGLGQATREAAYGADPAVLLKALAPRDSEQHPPRVLLIEERDAIAGALTATLERRGMQVARAVSDADAVTPAAQMRPNLVVMDLTQVRRRRAGIVDWLRANGLLSRTPLVVYTSAGIDPADLQLLSTGETVLFLAERSTSPEVQDRIVDLLAKIGAN